MKAKFTLSLGLLFVLVSFLWGYLVPESWFWDDARAIELIDLSDEFHGAMHKHDKDHNDDHHDHDHHDDHIGDTQADDRAELIAAAKKYQAAQAELDSAQLWANRMPLYLRWMGILVCFVGIALHVSTGNEARQ